MCERTNCFSSEDNFQWASRVVAGVCVCVRSRRRRLVVVRGAVRCVGGTFWSVGGEPTGAHSTTVARRRPTVPPWADSSSGSGQTSLLSQFNFTPPCKIIYNHFLYFILYKLKLLDGLGRPRKTRFRSHWS